MNHRVVANGTPLDRRLDNVALAARRAGYVPALFGYTDQAVDPRDTDGPDDPRLSTYTGILPGFDAVLDLPDAHGPWLSWLAARGVDVSGGPLAALATEHERPEELSVGAFLTDTFLAWLGEQRTPWFAHLSYLRPHPPYAAPGRWASEYDPAVTGSPIGPAPPGPDRHPLHEAALGIPACAAPTEPAAMAALRAQYFGMVSHVDHQVGRVWAALEQLGMWGDTVVVVTADHGEMLGDHGLLEKLGYWEQSYAVPCIVRDPRRPRGHGTVVDRFTENVDVFPTLCQAMDLAIPAQCDGLPLTSFLDGADPPWWRTAAHWEYDWRDVLIRAALAGSPGWPWDRTLARQHLTVLRTSTHAYVQFGSGEWMCFDLAADATWRTTTRDPEVVLPLAQEMLAWRSEHADRTLSDMLCEDGGIGRRPPGFPAAVRPGGGHPSPATSG
jgi:arylsulfatase A-like enzyme